MIAFQIKPLKNARGFFQGKGQIAFLCVTCMFLLCADLSVLLCSIMKFIDSKVVAMPSEFTMVLFLTMYAFISVKLKCKFLHL